MRFNEGALVFLLHGFTHSNLQLIEIITALYTSNIVVVAI